MPMDPPVHQETQTAADARNNAEVQTDAPNNQDRIHAIEANKNFIKFDELFGKTREELANKVQEVYNMSYEDDLTIFPNNLPEFWEYWSWSMMDGTLHDVTCQNREDLKLFLQHCQRKGRPFPLILRYQNADYFLSGISETLEAFYENGSDRKDEQVRRIIFNPLKRDPWSKWGSPVASSEVIVTKAPHAKQCARTDPHECSLGYGPNGYVAEYKKLKFEFKGNGNLETDYKDTNITWSRQNSDFGVGSLLSFHDINGQMLWRELWKDEVPNEDAPIVLVDIQEEQT